MGWTRQTTGYGACIAGIIELRVTLRGEDGTERKVQVAELVSKRIIVDEPEHVELIRSPDGVVLNWRLGLTGC